MDKQDREKLTELATGFRIFIKEWDVVKEHGFGFCRVNDNRIDNLQKSYIWLRSLVIALILLILTASIGYYVGDKDGYRNEAKGGRRILNSQPHGTGTRYSDDSKSLGQGQRQQI